MLGSPGFAAGDDGIRHGTPYASRDLVIGSLMGSRALGYIKFSVLMGSRALGFRVLIGSRALTIRSLEALALLCEATLPRRSWAQTTRRRMQTLNPEPYTPTPSPKP